MSEINGRRDAIVSGCAKPKERLIYDAGAPAKWITHGEELMLRRKAEKDKRRQELERSVLKMKKTIDRNAAHRRAETAVGVREQTWQEKCLQKLAKRETHSRAVEARRFERARCGNKKKRVKEVQRLTRENGKRLSA